MIVNVKVLRTKLAKVILQEMKCNTSEVINKLPIKA